MKPRRRVDSRRPPQPKWLGVAGLAATAMLACETPDDLIAPDGSSITIVTATQVVAAGGDSVPVAVTVQKKAGSLVDNGTVVLLSSSGGLLCCATGGARKADVSIALTTTRGVARAVLVPPLTGGSIALKARSGNASVEATITVADAVAPSESKLSGRLTPDSIGVAGKSELLAFIGEKDGSPVADGTRFVLEATHGTVAPAVVLSRQGFIGAKYTAGSQPGDAYVRVRSGALRDSVKVMVK